MKIKSIIIEVEIEEKDEAPGHAKTFTFMHGRWGMDGYCYPRIMTTLVDVWKLLKERIVEG